MSTLNVTNIAGPSNTGTAAILSSINGGPISGARNRIINGDMRIDQRNAGAAVTSDAATNPYTVDRWRSLAISGSGQFSMQRSTVAPATFSNSLLCTSLAATSLGASDAFGFRQAIEGLNCSDLGFGTANAQTATLSFWVRSSLTGTFGGAVANNSANRSYPFTFTINSANTFEYKTVAVPGDTTGTWGTDNTTGINIWFSLGMGSTRSGTAGAWAAADYRSATGATSVVGTNGATFYITGVQLEAGTVATPFERRSYGQELSLCQRYYEAGAFNFTGYQTIGNGYGQRHVFAVPKRATPTMTTTGSAGANLTNANLSADGPNSFANTGTASATGVVNFYGNFQASAEL
jgi:hypothetical protein